MTDGGLEVLQERLGYIFKDEEMLQQALTHRSIVSESGEGRDNERFEFLGDAVLELAVTHRLFFAGDGVPEGRLTQLRAYLVSGQALARFAQRFRLGEFIRLGKGEASSGGASKDSINANCLEAIIGAIYLDGGFDAALRFVSRFLGDPIREALELEDVRDAKSILQDYALRHHGILPRYVVVDATGQDHEKVFRVQVALGDSYRMTGTGRSKKAAEQDAAEKLLERINCISR